MSDDYYIYRLNKLKKYIEKAIEYAQQSTELGDEMETLALGYIRRAFIEIMVIEDEMSERIDYGDEEE